LIIEVSWDLMRRVRRNLEGLMKVVKGIERNFDRKIVKI
jgi:hypothetical protein